MGAGASFARPDPQVWGPAKWKEIELLIRTAPQEVLALRAILQAIVNCVYTLPCGACRVNFRHKILKRQPQLIDLWRRPTKKAIWHLWHELHNEVNADLNKPMISSEQALARSNKEDRQRLGSDAWRQFEAIVTEEQNAVYELQRTAL